MPLFLSKLIYEDNDGASWTLRLPLEYETDIGRIVPVAPDFENGELITVPEGFVTDLASIPAFAQNMISKVGPWDRPAVIHDWLYTTGQRPRAIADKVLLEAMAVTGTGWIRRRLIYAAVRVAGWKAWSDHRKIDSNRKP